MFFFSIVFGLIQETVILLSDSVVIFSHYIIILFVFYYSLFLIFFILTLPPCFFFLISPSYFAHDHIFVSPFFSSSERFWYLLRASFWSFSLFFFLTILNWNSVMYMKKNLKIMLYHYVSYMSCVTYTSYVSCMSQICS